MVRCADCGYLGAITGTWYDRWVDATPRERESGLRGTWENVADGNIMGPAISAHIACYRNEYRLEEESGSTSSETTLPVITKERDCAKFYPWFGHGSAELHLREHRVELLEKQRRDWEIAQEEDRRARAKEMERIGECLKSA